MSNKLTASEEMQGLVDIKTAQPSMNNAELAEMVGMSILRVTRLLKNHADGKKPMEDGEKREVLQQLFVAINRVEVMINQHAPELETHAEFVYLQKILDQINDEAVYVDSLCFYERYASIWCDR